MTKGPLVAERISVLIQLAGDVQGYGVRPIVACLAKQNQLDGSVRNCWQGVEIWVSGSPSKIRKFQASLGHRFPEATQHTQHATNDSAQIGFQILESNSDGTARFVVPLDRVICDECWSECSTPGNRRFGYALNGCSQCGPRYSIVKAMAYDRHQTSMSLFAMCSACLAEYQDPSHRRFHSQTNCCLECGPTIWFESKGDSVKDSNAAIDAATHAIIQGKILAVKGLGGYQLICDATNREAIARLRQRKYRKSKPLAVMVKSLTECHAFAEIDTLAQQTLSCPAGPIVILPSRTVSGLASNIGAGFQSIGLMLPTTALHALLLQRLQTPLVVTSGNHEGDPLEYREQEASLRLAEMADCFLHHNRPIVNPIDDSVVQPMAGRLVTLRAARGLAPMTIDLQTDLNLLSLGGHQKSAIAISNGHTMVLGPHVGDLDTIISRERFIQLKSTLQKLMHCERPVTVRDRHPDYYTSSSAENVGARPQMSVQHHHAHIASAMAEHGWLDRTVLGFAFDGTGLGDDGSIWGGEVLLSDANEFQRVAHLKPFRLAGGDAAIKQPWRIAMALLLDTFGASEALDVVLPRVASSWQCDPSQFRNLPKLLEVASLSPRTSSMGRLFDGVAAIACGSSQVSFEGEAAMLLESTCDQTVTGSYHFLISEESPFQMDWRPVVKELIKDLFSGLSSGVVAMKFHRAVANCIFQLASRLAEYPVVLAGGVFQNRILVELIDQLLRTHSSPVGMPGKIPVNDGGLAVGQLAIAASRIARTSPCV